MEVIVGLIICAFLLWWIGWPILEFADREHLEIWEAMLITFAGSLVILLVSALVAYVVTPPPPAPQIPEPARPAPLTQEGLLPGHSVGGHKVKTYETHWIAGEEYLFAFIPWPREKYRIYILKSPGYGQRASDSITTHRLSDGQRRYICVDSRAFPETLTDARELALMWSQATARYIKTGKKFS